MRREVWQILLGVVVGGWLVQVVDVGDVMGMVRNGSTWVISVVQARQERQARSVSDGLKPIVEAAAERVGRDAASRAVELQVQADASALRKLIAAARSE